MTAIATTIRLSNASNALIKAWGSAISQALSSIGLVQTADTGQINWTTTTVTATSSAQTFGYEIWRFNDTLQATRPIFIKVIYGTTNNGTTYPRFALFVGTGTDGAGNLTGLQLTARSDMASLSSALGNPNNSPYAQPAYFFGDGSSIAIALPPYTNINPNANPGVLFWFVERTRNADNTPNGDGVVFGMHLASRQDGVYFSTYNYISFINNAVVGNNFYWPIAYPSNDYNAPSVDGTTIVAYPFLVAMPKPEAQACTVLGWQGGINNYQTVSLVVNGAARTYLALPGVCGSMPGTSTENNSGARNWCSLLMRFE
jgi:hypothetical protein